MPGLLDKLSTKFLKKTNEDLEHEIEDLRVQRHEFVIATPPPKERAYAGIDELVTNSQVHFARLVSDMRGQVPDDPRHPWIRELVDAFVLGSPEFAEKLRAAVDGAPAGTYADLDETTYARKLAAFDKEIAARETELERRERQAKVDVAQAELAQLEQ